MKKTSAFYLAAFLILSPTFVLAQKNFKKQKDTLEQQIRKLDAAQADAVLRKDYEAFDRLCAEDFTVNNPWGEITKGRTAVKEQMRSGKISHTSFLREIESVSIYGKTAIVMGRETVVTGANSQEAGRTVRRRYTNVWMKRNGKWLLTARHASVIPEKTF